VDVLVDTSVWSLAFRRPALPSESKVTELAGLIQRCRAVMVGPVRHEILSGIRDAAQFNRLRGALRAFPDLPIITSDYEMAALFFTRCRARGIQATRIDFLFCAGCSQRAMSVITTDNDFAAFGPILPIRLHPICVLNCRQLIDCFLQAFDWLRLSLQCLAYRVVGWQDAQIVTLDLEGLNRARKFSSATSAVNSTIWLVPKKDGN